ncbi:AAC(3) family N-acetyltransferase [Nostoc linckia FACHB-104]|nr:AAC(3) family N-acetyltransferase [Nostoc linckia FACHB-104]
MSEAQTIVSTPLPRTRSSLLSDLHQLGLTEGMTVIVHSSLSSLGWVCGGPVTVVQALMDAVTVTGTLVMPTHSGNYSDPAGWQAPPVPEDWWTIIRETMPAFDPKITPTRGMGQIVEVFRTCPDVMRSYHPESSFAAWGQYAQEIVKDHSLDYSLGEGSPLARLYDLNSWVLLLGVGYDNCTCFHLAEYRSGKAKEMNKQAPIFESGQRIWKSYTDIDFDTDSFVELGAAFEQAGQVKVSKVGSATAKLFSLRDAVDWAVRWFKDV